MLITITLSLFFMHCVIEPNGWLLMRIGPFFQKIFKSRIKIMIVILWWSVQHSSNRTRYLNTYMYFYDIDELGTWKCFLRWTEYALQRKGMFHWCSICYGMSLKVWTLITSADKSRKSPNTVVISKVVADVWRFCSDSEN